MKIGSAKYGFTQRKYFKLKEGDVTFRILPPMGELADDGKWSMFYAVHYGYKNSQGKLRVFQSPEVKNRSNGMIEVPDAALERIKKLKAEFDKAKSAGNKAVMEKIGPLVSGQKPMYNLDKNHYLNVIDSQGNIGVLKLRHKAKQVLDQQIKKLREKGVDPLSVDNGRFFTFTRSGNGLDTSFAVSVAQKDIFVEGVGDVKQDIVHKLDAAIIARLKDEAAALNKLFKALTSEEVARIVAESDLLTGKSRAVDEILDAKKDGGADVMAEDDMDDEIETATVATAQPVAAAPVEPVVTVTPSSSVTTTIVPPSAPIAATAPSVAAPAASEQSDADFLKSLGL